VSEWRVLIGSRSFGRAFPEHIEALTAAGCDVAPNDVGRSLTAPELLERLPGCHAIVTGTDALTAEVIASAPQLRTIAKHGVGLDTVDVAAAQARGISVSTTPGTNHDSVADLALALLLAVVRHLPAQHASTTRGEWKPGLGTELRGRTLGLVGLGRIGREVALRAQAFGMAVCAHDPWADESWAHEHGVDLLELDVLLTRADVVSLHAPGGERPVLGREELAQMREGAIVINTARGSLLDEAALAEALQAGRLGGAGLDVFAHEPPEGSPLLGLDGVVATPHVGGRTRDAQRRMGEVCLANCLAGLRGEL